MIGSKREIVAFGSGVVFALGLGISGMTQPSKVLAFLDVAGAWDPTLAFVMMGAIGVHLMFARRALTAKAPLLAPKFVLPGKKTIDAPLVIGSTIFGIGWGIGGLCPGPALVAIVTLRPAALAFLAAMVIGMLAYDLRPTRQDSENESRSPVPD
jgi:hypothetical protein